MALGAVLVAIDLALRALSNSLAWVWIAGAAFLSAGAVALFRSRVAPSQIPPYIAKNSTPPGLETSRLLDNFEQRFAELKKRTPNAAVLDDLYALGTQLEQRDRRVHATAVYRHLARLDGGFRDVASRLKKLIDTEATVGQLRTVRPVPPPPIAAPSRPVAAERVASVAATNEGVAGDLKSLGRYKLEREIGRGAMGTVYLGRDSAINRLVAIKAIPLAKEFSDSELAEARARFFREAETAGRLNHPNIVTIYDVGEQDGLAYIAMEYLRGKHLSDFATSNTLLEPRKVIELVARTADALGFAHKQNVVHRDIKPANLMYDMAGDTLKITDFGIARLTDAGSTRTGIVLGTPSFMSPEQLEGRIVTGHSDLFSLGVTLFQLLSGQLPFRADTIWNGDAALSLADADRAKWDYHPIMSSPYVQSGKSDPGLFYFRTTSNRFGVMTSLMKSYVRRRQAHLDQLLAGYGPPPAPRLSGPGSVVLADGRLILTAKLVAESKPGPLQWRLAEITDPKSSAFDPRKPWRYEIEAIWQKESAGAATMGVPLKDLLVGHTYRARVRSHPAEGLASRWSEPFEFVAR